MLRPYLHGLAEPVLKYLRAPYFAKYESYVVWLMVLRFASRAIGLAKTDLRPH